MACVKYSTSKNCVAASKGPVGKAVGLVSPAEQYGMFIQVRPCSEVPTGILVSCRANSDRTRGDGFKLKEGRFRLDIIKKFFMLRVMKPWHRFPREVIDAPSLETFKVGSDRALSSLIQLKMSLLMAGGWGWMALEGPSQPKPFYDSVI